MKKFVLLAMLFLLNLANAQNWQTVVTGNQGTIANQVDFDSIKKIYNNPKYKIIAYSVKTLTNKPQTTYEGKHYDYIVRKYWVDCVAKSYLFKESQYFLADKTEVASYIIDENTWEKPNPNTLGSTHIEAACKTAGY